MKSGGFKKEDREEEEGASWLDSYSDLVTDLLAVFVILFSFAMMNQAYSASKLTENPHKANAEVSVVDNSVEETGVLDGSSSVLPDDDGLTKEDGQDSEFEDEQGEGEEDQLMESINSYIDEVGESDQMSIVKQPDNTILLRVNTSILFDSGQAEIKREAIPLLNKISDVLGVYGEGIEEVRIEGHTDNIVMKSKEFDSNWELSASRAVNVLRELLENTELDGNKLYAAGFAEHRPIADNKTADGRAKNRRVDFVIRTKSITE